MPLAPKTNRQHRPSGATAGHHSLSPVPELLLLPGKPNSGTAQLTPVLGNLCRSSWLLPSQPELQL